MSKLIICVSIIGIFLLNGCSSQRDPRFIKGTPENIAYKEYYAKINARAYREAAGNYTGYPVGSAEYKERMRPEYVAMRKKRDAINKANEEAQRQANARAIAKTRTVNNNTEKLYNQSSSKYKSRMSNSDIANGANKSFNPNSSYGNSSTYMRTKVGKDLYHVQELGTSSNYGPGDFKAVSF